MFRCNAPVICSVSEIVDGQLYTWGDNRQYQLGAPSDQQQHTLKQEASQQPIHANYPPTPTAPHRCSNTRICLPFSHPIRFTNISCGWRHTIAVTDTGQLWCWGSNRYGQLGTGDAITRTTPTNVRIYHDTATNQIVSTSAVSDSITSTAQPLVISKGVCGWKFTVCLTGMSLFFHRLCFCYVHLFIFFILHFRLILFACPICMWLIYYE